MNAPLQAVLAVSVAPMYAYLRMPFDLAFYMLLLITPPSLPRKPRPAVAPLAANFLLPPWRPGARAAASQGGPLMRPPAGHPSLALTPNIHATTLDPIRSQRMPLPSCSPCSMLCLPRMPGAATHMSAASYSYFYSSGEPSTAPPVTESCSLCSQREACAMAVMHQEESSTSTQPNRLALGSAAAAQRGPGTCSRSQSVLGCSWPSPMLRRAQRLVPSLAVAGGWVPSGGASRPRRRASPATLPGADLSAEPACSAADCAPSCGRGTGRGADGRGAWMHAPQHRLVRCRAGHGAAGKQGTPQQGSTGPAGAAAAPYVNIPCP